MLRERAGVQLDVFRPNAPGGLDLFQLGRDEQADGYAGTRHLFAHFCETAPLTRRIRSAFRRYLLSPFGNDADDARPDFESDGDNCRRIGHFQIQPRPDGLAQAPDIAILDVPAVFPQMSRYPVRS